VVVCPSQKMKPYAAFGLDDESPTTGCDVELRSRSFFIGCKDHFKELSKFISLKCPSCQSNFQSEKALFKHVKVAHSLQFCELCFDHRPLFSCEQRLMTSTELTEHLNSLPGSMIGSGGDKSGGHPLCKFCSQRSFDSQALYAHMRDEHFTCHLCPSRYQQRFYRGLPQLLNHVNNSHFVCQVCLPPSSFAAATASTDNTGFRSYNTVLHCSFARKDEYTDHMRSSHGIISSSGSSNQLSLAIAASFPVGRPRGASTSEDQSSFEFLDLNMASADPYRLDSSANQSSPPAESVEAERSYVPPHMRVLGRVTGGGTFLSDFSPELEEARLEEVRNGGRTQRGPKEKEKTGPAQRPQQGALLRQNQPNDFPALVSTSGPGTNPQEASSVAAKPHPLSVVPSLIEKEKVQKARASEEESTRLQEREIAVRKVQRNMVSDLLWSESPHPPPSLP
jgi:hypothetical protein